MTRRSPLRESVSVVAEIVVTQPDRLEAIAVASELSETSRPGIARLRVLGIGVDRTVAECPDMQSPCLAGRSAFTGFGIDVHDTPSAVIALRILFGGDVGERF